MLNGTAEQALTYTYPIQDNLQELIIRRQLLQELQVPATGQVDEDRDGIFGDRLENNIQDQYRRCSAEAHGMRPTKVWVFRTYSTVLHQYLQIT